MSQPSETRPREVKGRAQDDSKRTVLLGLAPKLSGKNSPFYTSLCLLPMSTEPSEKDGLIKILGLRKGMGIRETAGVGVSWTLGRALGR